MWLADNNSRTSAFHSSNFIPENTPLYFWIFSGINGLVTLICNILVIFIVLKRRRLIKNQSNWLLLSLAVADLSVGTIMIPSIFVCFFSPQLTCHTDWTISNIVYDMLLHTSVSNLCIVTMDRYLWVTLPMSYQTFMTRKSILTLISLSWILPISFQTVHAILEYTLPKDKKLNSEKTILALKISIFEIGPCILMLFVYGHIFGICWRHSRSISKINKSLYVNCKKTMAAKSSVTSTVKVFCLVIPIFMLCWTLTAYREICNTYYYSSCRVPTDLVHISRLLLKGHSMIDPIVYALQKREIRKEMSRLLKERQLDEMAGSNAYNTQEGCVTPRLTRMKLIKRK